jgi:hypothetical protein
MKEVLFSQRVNYAIVKKYREYSPINSKPKNISDVFGDNFFDKNEQGYTVHSIPPPVVRGKNVKHLFYFVDPDTKSHGINRFMHAPFGGVYVTQDTDKIGKYLGDKLSSISIHTRENRIEREGNTLRLVLDHYVKRREFNSKFSKKSVNKIIIKFDFDKGNTHIMVQRGNQKEFRINCLWLIEELYFHHFAEVFPKEEVPKKARNKSIEMSMSFELFMLTFKTLCLGYVDISKFKSGLNLHGFSKIKDFLVSVGLANMVTKKNIKINDNYRDILINYYPNQRYLKKNDNKLIQSCLDRLGVNHPSINKIVHRDFRTIFYLNSFKNIFGEDFHRYFANIQWGDCVDLKTSTSPNKFSLYNRELGNEDFPSLNDKIEKTNALKIINDSLSPKNAIRKRLSEVLGELQDHLSIIDRIKEHYEGIKLRSTTLRTFEEEHRNYSVLETRVKREHMCIREYDQKFIKLISEPIEDEEQMLSYRVRLLTTQDHYEDEGYVMKHCVGGYIHYEKSIIISVIENNSKERVTLEYDRYSGNLLQSRGTYNSPPSDKMKYAINELNRRMFSTNVKMRSSKKMFVDKWGMEVVETPNKRFFDIDLDF